MSAIVVSALALTLAACGGGGSDSGAEDALPTDPNAALTGEITMWSSFTQGPRAEWMERMADKFEAEHPGVKINIELFSWDEFNTKWTTGLAAGQVPDISTAQPNQVVDMINADALVPLNDVIDSIGRDRFYEPSLLEGASGDQNYSMPNYSHAQVMWYRKDILEEKGIPVPTTWEELEAACAKIGKSADLYPLAVPMGTNDMLATRYVNFYVRSMGETLLKDNGHANLDSEAAAEALRYWADMYKKYSPEGAINYKILDNAKLFYQGKTVFDFNSGFHISGTLKDRPDLDGKIAAAPMPRHDSSDPAVYPGEVSNIAMVLWEASDAKPAAKAFLASLYETDEYINYLHSIPGGMLPALKDIREKEKYKDDPTIQKYADSIKAIEDQVAIGSAIGMENGPTVQAGILTSQGVTERALQSVVLENVSPAEAGAAASQELDKLFEAAGVEFK